MKKKLFIGIGAIVLLALVFTPAITQRLVLLRDFHPSVLLAFRDTVRTVVSDSLAALSADGVTITNSGGTFKQVVFADTAALKAVSGSAGNRVVLKQLASGDADGGGVFIWKTSGYAAKRGAVYTASGGVWVREEYAADTTYFELDWVGARTDTEVEAAIKRMADGSTIVFGEGFYTGDINLNGATAPDSMTFKGQGIFKTISTGGFQALDYQGFTLQDMSFIRSTNGDVLQFGASSSDSTFVIDGTLKNLRVGGNGKANTAHLILVQRGGKMNFENIRGYGGSNLIAARIRDSYFNNIYGESDMNYVITIKAGGSTSGPDDGDNQNFRVSNVWVPTGSIGVFVHGADGYTIKDGTITNVVGDTLSKSIVTIWTDAASVDGYANNITVSNCVGTWVDGNAFLSYGGDMVTFSNCIVDSASGAAFAQVNNTNGTPSRVFVYGGITRKIGAGDWSGNFKYVQVNDSTYAPGGFNVIGPVNFATETFDNIAQRQILRVGSLGTSQNDLINTMELRGLTSSNMALNFALFRHTAGSSYNSAAWRIYQSVDNSHRNGLNTWMEFGYNSAFQHYWKLGYVTSTALFMRNGNLSIGHDEIPTTLSIKKSQPIFSITDGDINLNVSSSAQVADSAAITLDASQQAGHTSPTIKIAKFLNQYVEFYPDTLATITPVDTIYLKVVINGTVRYIPAIKD